MRRAAGTSRRLLPWLTLVALLSGCRSAPVAQVSISPASSLLAVDVLFPAPLSRDPSLVQAFLMKGPVPDGADELPELIPATFVKGSRAYLLDPEPGSWSVVAVTAEYAPPSNYHAIDGVTDTVWSGTSSDAMIFPAELIQRTTTRVAPGEAAFVGVLRVRRGDHINANAVPQDDLQKQIAERIRPGVTSESGLSGWLMRARGVDLEETSLSNQPADRQAFLEAALVDLGVSPWAEVIARAKPSGDSLVARPRARLPRSQSPPKAPVKIEAKSVAPSPAPIPEAVAARPQPTVAEPQAAPQAAPPEVSTAEPQAAPPEIESTIATPAEVEPTVATPAEAESTLATAIPEPEPLPVAPTPKPFAGVPPDSPLAQIELGMNHDEVREILGSPDGRIDRLTAKAWNPFYNGPDANRREWIYAGRGRVVFSLYEGSLEVIDVVYDPSQEK